MELHVLIGNRSHLLLICLVLTPVADQFGMKSHSCLVELLYALLQDALDLGLGLDLVIVEKLLVKLVLSQAISVSAFIAYPSWTLSCASLVPKSWTYSCW